MLFTRLRAARSPRHDPRVSQGAVARWSMFDFSGYPSHSRQNAYCPEIHRGKETGADTRDGTLERYGDRKSINNIGRGAFASVTCREREFPRTASQEMQKIRTLPDDWKSGRASAASSGKQCACDINKPLRETSRTGWEPRRVSNNNDIIVIPDKCAHAIGQHGLMADPDRETNYAFTRGIRSRWWSLRNSGVVYAWRNLNASNSWSNSEFEVSMNGELDACEFSRFYYFFIISVFISLVSTSRTMWCLHIVLPLWMTSISIQFCLAFFY